MVLIEVGITLPGWKGAGLETHLSCFAQNDHFIGLFSVCGYAVQEKNIFKEKKIWIVEFALIPFVDMNHMKLPINLKPQRSMRLC